MKELSTTEVRKAIKDVRVQLNRVRTAVDSQQRLLSLKECEHLYSLVFDMRKLIQDGGKWEPDESEK